jgi:hypothetical protein
MYAVTKSRAFVHAHATKLCETGLSQYMTAHVHDQHLLEIRESGALRPQAAHPNHTENMR